MNQLVQTLRSPWQPCEAKGWTQIQPKRRYSIELGKMLQNEPSQRDDLEVPYLKAQHVQWEGVRLDEPPRMWASPAEVESLRVQKDDLLVCEGGEVGRGAVVRTTPPANCIIQNALHLVRGRDSGEVRFLLYLLRHAATQGWFDVLCNRATIAHLTGDKFGEMWVWSPELSEQRRIADLLDRETARLDALVAEKERWLELVAEKRRALITRAVTRGLNLAALLRDSGLPWLGQIPSHWQIKQLKFACNGIQTGGTPTLDYMDSADEKTVNWFTPVDFNESLELRDSSRKISQEAVEVEEAPLFPTRTAYVVGIGATLGKVGYCVERASANQQVNALLPRPETDSLFLAFMLSTLDDLMQALANSATLPILNQQRMGEISVAVPPPDEQHAIVAHISAATAKLDGLRAATERTIGLLKERRAALIAAAVTGKISVSTLVADGELASVV